MKGVILLVAFLFYSTRMTKTAASDVALPEIHLYSIDSNENLTVLERWEKLEKRSKEIANTLLKMVLPIVMDNAAKVNLSRECMKNGLHLLAGVKNLKTWAIRFLDSSGKLMNGILVGSLSSFGAYDECLDTEVKSTRLRDRGKVLFRGQYCTINVKVPITPRANLYKMDDVMDELKNFSQKDSVIAEVSKLSHFFHFLSVRWGICTPSGCTLEDVDKIANLLGNQLALDAKTSRCEVKEENNFTPLIKTVIACYSFAGFLMLVGSLIDMYAYYKNIVFKNTFIRVLLAFSFISNFRKLVNTETSSKTFSCLNGMRFIGMSWVILAHSYGTVNFQIFLGLEKARDYPKDFAFQVVVNASYVVDTFFFIGGLLVCYIAIKLIRDRGHNFHVGWYIFHRLWRIIPLYVFMIMSVFLLDLIGSGPVWHETTHKYIKACYDNWWTNILFINNFYDAENMCIIQSWYLAADFQLYVGSLIVLLPIIRWPKAGISVGIVSIIASIIYSGVVTYVNDFPPATLLVNADPNGLLGYLASFYFKPFIHVSPYCIGLLSGYLLVTKPDLKIPPIIQIVGWSVAFVCNFTIVYGIVDWNRGVEPSFWGGMFYSSLSRTVWTLGVAWMVICCATGHGGIINHILSWKAFIPLGRLSYGAYIVHYIIQITFFGNVRTQIQADQFLAVWLFLGHMCVSYGVAFAGSMLIEAPFMSLEKVFLPRETEPENTLQVNGTLNLQERFKTNQNGDISAIVPKTDEESGGIDNICNVYKL